MGKCSTLLVIKEMQIKMAILFSAGKCITFPKNGNTQTDRGVVKLILSHTAGGNVSLYRQPF
jgi:hypothetical protein